MRPEKDKKNGTSAFLYTYIAPTAANVLERLGNRIFFSPDGRGALFLA